MLAVVVMFLMVGSASAQSLRGATWAYSVASAADLATTGVVLSQPGGREANPLAQPFAQSPGQLVVTGATIDAVTIWAATKWLGPKHPKLTRTLLYVGAGIRGSLALHNLRVAQR